MLVTQGCDSLLCLLWCGGLSSLSWWTKPLMKWFKVLCSFRQRDQLCSLLCLLAPQTADETGAGQNNSLANIILLNSKARFALSVTQYNMQYALLSWQMPCLRRLTKNLCALASYWLACSWAFLVNMHEIACRRCMNLASLKNGPLVPVHSL